MHLFIGGLLSGLMISTPFAFQINIATPPVNLTGWLVFAISLGGILSLISIIMTRMVIKPAIMEELKNIPNRIEFNFHVEDDKAFQERMDNFITNYWEHGISEHRAAARRKGDPK